MLVILALRRLKWEWEFETNPYFIGYFGPAWATLNNNTETVIIGYIKIYSPITFNHFLKNKIAFSLAMYLLLF